MMIKLMMRTKPLSLWSTARVGAPVLAAGGTFATSVHAWDHLGHMTTANVAYSELERARPAGMVRYM
jgi:hypothetical protein